MSRRKKRPMKRAYLKLYSAAMVNTGPRVVDHGSPLRMHGTGRIPSEEEIKFRHRRDLWIDKRMMEVYGKILDRPPAFGVFNRAPTKPWKAVQDALARLNLEEQVMWEDRDAHERRITLRDMPEWKVELMWSRDHRRYVLLEFDGLGGYLRESIRYTNRDRALFVFNHKQIQWKYVTPIPAEIE